MKKSSSKKQMEDKLEIFAKIQKVNAPDEMYGNILSILKNRENTTVSMTWIRNAAAAILVLISVESYMLIAGDFKMNQDTTPTIESIIPSSNNLLIYD
jgi:fructose 1,6-bisphosphatase